MTQLDVWHNSCDIGFLHVERDLNSPVQEVASLQLPTLRQKWLFGVPFPHERLSACAGQRTLSTAGCSEIAASNFAPQTSEKSSLMEFDIGQCQWHTFAPNTQTQGCWRLLLEVGHVLCQLLQLGLEVAKP